MKKASSSSGSRSLVLIVVTMSMKGKRYSPMSYTTTTTHQASSQRNTTQMDLVINSIAPSCKKSRTLGIKLINGSLTLTIKLRECTQIMSLYCGVAILVMTNQQAC